MKIKFYNLGTIKETELDLRPLTVIIGPNNSNKTYIAYSVYGLLQQARELKGSVINFNLLKNQKDITIDVGDTFVPSINNYCRSTCERFADSLETFYQELHSKSVCTNTIFSNLFCSRNKLLSTSDAQSCYNVLS